MNEMQNVIFDMMKSIHTICEKNNITYYIVGGTMLGAIRHGGFIPWDDDMDISMPREDYNRFIHLPKNELPEWMEIISPEDRDINLGYAKVMNKKTTIVENFLGVRIGGVFIDVFPLDGIGNDYRKSMRRMKYIQFLTFVLRANQGLSNVNTMYKRIFSKFAPMIHKKFIFNSLVKYSTKYRYKDCEFVANTVGAYALKELTPKKYYGTPKLYKFETACFYGVEKPDEFLRGLYGDYMELPPEEKRISQHGVSFIDLSLPYNEYIKQRGK